MDTIKHINLLGIVVLGIAQQLHREIKEYCHMETFTASCPEGDVILMETALYGRMRLGRCLTTDYNVGCKVDVLLQFDSKCSGRQNCSFPIPDTDLFSVQSCRRDLLAYLEASYSCVTALDMSPSTCPKGRIVLHRQEGYLVSMATQLTGSCTVSLQAKVGQQINVTLYDLNRYNRVSDPVTTDRCPIYTSIKENNIQPSHIQICGSTKSNRQVSVYKSVTNQLNMTMLSGQNPRPVELFMLYYKAIGCPDVTAPPMAFIHRVKDKLLVTCNQTNEKWHLVCKGNTWIGNFNNCSMKTIDSIKVDVVGNNPRTKKDDLPIGLLVAITLGVLLGVFAGFIFLLMAFLCRKSFQQNRQHVRTSLLGNHDVQCNMYKMVDVEAPPGEDPCYMCNHEASVYTKSGLDVPSHTLCRQPINTFISNTNTPSRCKNQDYERPIITTSTEARNPIYELNNSSGIGRTEDVYGSGHSQTDNLYRSGHRQTDSCLPASVTLYSTHSGNHRQMAYTAYKQPEVQQGDYSFSHNDCNDYSFRQNDVTDSNPSFLQSDGNIDELGHKTMMEKYPLPSVSVKAQVKYT